MPRPARAQGLDKVRFGFVATDDMTPVIYAMQHGLYQKAGLDIEPVITSSGSASTAAVIGGAYEIGKASPIASILAHVRGLPLTLVANGAIWTQRNLWNRMVVTTDSPIKTGADCNGKVAGVSGLNDILQLSMASWIDKNGGDSKSVKWLELPTSAQAAALTAHRIDIGELNEPLLSAALADGKVRALADAYTAVANRWTASVYFVRPDWAAKNVDLVKRFIKVTYESAAYTNAHPAETVSMMSEVTKIPLDVYGKLARIQGSTASDPSLLQPLIALAAHYQIIPSVFPAKEMYFSG
jgi:NitT/TauT family transport system substrate-binding protein